MKFVPLQQAMALPVVAGLTLEFPSGRGSLDLHRQPPPTLLQARDWTPKGGKKLRKDSGVRPSALVLAVFRSELALRRTLIEPLLQKYGATGDVDLVPIVLNDELGPLECDFVWVNPKQRLPLDRDAALAEYENPQNRHGSRCVRVQELLWGPGREPRAVLFRLGEHPDVVVAREDFALDLAKVTMQGLAPHPAPYRSDTKGADMDFRKGYQMHLGMNDFYPYADAVAMPETAPAEVSSRAAAGYFRLYAGAGEPGDREAVLACPHYAHYLAAAVDCDANDDTGAATLRHPMYAFLYASQVDHSPRDDTRLAAAQHPLSALAYARYVDGGPHPVTERGANHPAIEGSYAQDMLAAAKWATWRAAGEPVLDMMAAYAPAPVAARPVPTIAVAPTLAVEVPRYADDATAADAKPGHAPVAAEVRSDIDEFIGKGLELVGLDANATPQAVVAALHTWVDQLQLGQHKITKKQQVQMALGCALGEQLHRALGYQWAQVADKQQGGGVALVDPQRAVAVYVFVIAERMLAAKAKHNGIALTYNMLVAGTLPPGAKPGAYVALT